MLHDKEGDVVNHGFIRRAAVVLVLGTAMPAAARAEVLRFAFGQATLPGDHWNVFKTDDGQPTAVRTLSATQFEVATIRVVPVTGDAALGPRLEELRQSLLGPRKNLVYFEAFPWQTAGLDCLFYQAIRRDVPPYDAPQAPWLDRHAGAICAAPAHSARLEMDMILRATLADPDYIHQATDAEDLFDSLTLHDG